MEKWYFISFRNPQMNRNLGCCNVSAKGGPQEALDKTVELEINPGGEAAIFLISEPELVPNRLYSRQEMIDLDYKKINE